MVVGRNEIEIRTRSRWDRTEIDRAGKVSIVMKKSGDGGDPASEAALTSTARDARPRSWNG